MRPYTLSEAEERLLAMASDPLDKFDSVFTAIDSSDLSFDTMEEAFDSAVDWDAEATVVYQKKYGGTPIEGDWDARQRERGRRLRFMQYRGFGAEISQRLVNEDDQGERSAEDSE